MTIIKGDVSIEMIDELLANPEIMACERDVATSLREILEGIQPTRDGIKDLNEGEKEALRELQAQKKSLPVSQRNARARHIRSLEKNIESLEKGIEDKLRKLEFGIAKLNRLRRVRENSTYRGIVMADVGRSAVWLIAAPPQPKTNQISSAIGAATGTGILIASVTPIVVLGAPLWLLGVTIPSAVTLGPLTWFLSTLVGYRGHRISEAVIPIDALREWQKAQTTGLFDEFVIIGDNNNAALQHKTDILCGVVYNPGHDRIHFEGNRTDGHTCTVSDIPGYLFEITHWKNKENKKPEWRGKV